MYCLLRQGTRFIMYILDISRSFFFFEMTFEINHENSPHWWEIGCLLGVKLFFYHIFVRVISNTALNWTAKHRVDSSSLAIDVIFLLNVDIDIIIFLIADNR